MANCDGFGVDASGEVRDEKRLDDPEMKWFCIY